MSIKYSKENAKHSNAEKLHLKFESTITNEDLLYILQNTDRKKICLLDTRPADIFQKYRITSCDVINIPKENIVPG